MDLKIVTFNIRCDYGQDGENQFCYRKDLIKNKIEKEHPDIICFQEVLPHVAKWLKDNLTDYYVVGCGREKELDGEQMTVAVEKTRFQMISMETYSGSSCTGKQVRRAVHVSTDLHRADSAGRNRKKGFPADQYASGSYWSRSKKTGIGADCQ